MPTYRETIEVLRRLFQTERDLRALAKKKAPGEMDEHDALNQRKINEALETLIRFPPHLLKHADRLKAFHDNGRVYEKSVFIMTKFPDGDNPADKELTKVIETVKDSIAQSGFHPRIALGHPRYFPTVWDNVEIHLLGCGRGVAVIENRYKKELNPNVALEWGWMRAMDKPVLFLLEKDFKEFRADILGFIPDTFSWEQPEQEIPGHISAWLKGDKK